MFSRTKAFAAASLAALLLTAPALAGTAVPNRAAFTALQGVADATSTTFATTAYADLTGATVSVTPSQDPNRTEAPGTVVPTSYIRASLTLNMSKATATNGTCGLWVNGAVLAKTEQAVAFLAGAPNANVSATWVIPNTTTGTQTVKVRCKSGDTNILTVSAGHLVVETVE